MSDKAIAPSAHHPRGPSKFTAWAWCPCFEAEPEVAPQLDDLEVEAPEQDHTARNRGIAQHEALAKVLLDKPDAFTGLSESEDGQVRWVAEQVVGDAAASGYSKGEIRVEQRLELLGPGFDTIYFGTADVEFGPFLDDAKFGEIRDYFAQMAGYALAKMERDGLRTVFARLRFARARRTVSHTITKDTAERVVYGILAKVDSPVKQPKPCEYCGWCARAANCEALNAIVEGVRSQKADWRVSLPATDPDRIGTDPVMIGALRWVWKSYIQPWGEKVEYLSSMAAVGGVTPLGFRRQDERGQMEFTAPVVTVLDAMEKAGVPRETVINGLRLSMTALVGAYKAQFGVGDKKAEAAVETILSASGVAARGRPAFKLMRSKTGEDDLRLALARPAPKEVTP